MGNELLGRAGDPGIALEQAREELRRSQSQTPGLKQRGEMNLCRPDTGKSCASCCGLYNVADGTRPSLFRKLLSRTTLFRTVQRSPSAIQEFGELIQRTEAAPALDEAIHSCEFTGFVDPEFTSVGCMLHPTAAENYGIDFRGLCHYGSMACKAFFCPAWTEVLSRHLTILSDVIDDWHLWGLVATDVDYLSALFGLVEGSLGEPADLLLQSDSRPREIFTRMLAWKDSWPMRGTSTLRRSRYYCKGSFGESTDVDQSIEVMLECLRFTFDTKFSQDGGRDLIRRTLDELIMAGKSTMP